MKPAPQEKLSVSVILPTYNEAENIIELIDAIEAALADHASELIVVDDDSPDGTWRLVEQRSATDPRTHLIRRVDERGLTTAIAAGVEASTGAAVVWMDCDFSMPPAKIPELIEALDTCDIAVGSRYVDGGRDVRDSRLAVVMSRIINGFAQLMLGQGIRDYTTGFVAARREVVTGLGLRGDYGEYCIALLSRAVREGYRVSEIPYHCIPRERGTSKTATSWWQFLVRGRKYIATVLRETMASSSAKSADH